MSNERTSKKVASKASKVLRDPNASADEKSVAASALNQAEDREPRKAPATTGFDFNPKYHKNEAGEVTGVEHTRAQVIPRTELPDDATDEVKELVAEAEKLNGLTVEIHGQTSDGRRLCVSKSGKSAWLSVEDLEAAE